jgi:antagonist of KipI
MMIKVRNPGLLTTVQDLGRWGYQKHGIVACGAMDNVAHRVANALVGNSPNAATLELTLAGPTLEFLDDALIAICGADFTPSIFGIPVHSWRAVYVQRGSVLSLGGAGHGSRAYLAIGGGIEVPEVLGSRSTYLRAGIGGLEGRALQGGDVLNIGEPSDVTARAMDEGLAQLGPVPFALSDLGVDPGRLGYNDLDSPVRALHGPHHGLFGEHDRKAFFSEPFVVSEHSDRMGYRLIGERLQSASGESIISTAVVNGSVQVPPGGEPIVLMVDRQTTGGYPIIAQVVSCDLPRIAQLKPGSGLNFVAVTVDEAQVALRTAERDLDMILEEAGVYASSRSQ